MFSVGNAEGEKDCRDQAGECVLAGAWHRTGSLFTVEGVGWLSVTHLFNSLLTVMNQSYGVLRHVKMVRLAITAAIGGFAVCWSCW
jgi:hypothetical protein